MRKLSAQNQGLCVGSNGFAAPTRALNFAPLFPCPNPQTQGFSTTRKASFWHVTVNKSCPAVRRLSCKLSRWFLFAFNGLGGLSGCPAEFTPSYVCMRARVRKAIAAGHAGQPDKLFFILILFNKFNKIEKYRVVPMTVPMLSRSAKCLKLNKILGWYCHG